MFPGWRLAIIHSKKKDMVELINLNLRKSKPDYFYVVREFVTTFQADPGKNEAYSHEEEFRDSDLRKCKEKAEAYYLKRLIGLEFVNTRYFLEFAAPENFVLGKNAAFSITLSLVEYYSEDDYVDHVLYGESDEETAQSREVELEVFRDLGLL